MQLQELQNKLMEAITTDEWNRLKHGDSSLKISSFNRDVLLSMKNAPVENFEIDIKSVYNLKEALQRYLDIYMADCPIGHKWIIIACITLLLCRNVPCTLSKQHTGNVLLLLKRRNMYAPVKIQEQIVFVPTVFAIAIQTVMSCLTRISKFHRACFREKGRRNKQISAFLRVESNVLFEFQEVCL